MLILWPWIPPCGKSLNWSSVSYWEKIPYISLSWRGHQIIMAKGVDPPPQSTWGLPYLTGRRLTILVSRILNGSKKIPCVAGVQSPRAYATIGEDGSVQIFRTRLGAVRQKRIFKVILYSWFFVSNYRNDDTVLHFFTNHTFTGDIMLILCHELYRYVYLTLIFNNKFWCHDLYVLIRCTLCLVIQRTGARSHLPLSELGSK